MNLSAYDNATNNIDKSKTWISVKNKLILTKEIKHRKYYILLKRFNVESKSYDFFLAVTDKKVENKDCKKLLIDYGFRKKINAYSIWLDSSLCTLKEDTNIELKLVEEQEDGEVYELDI